MNMKLKKSSLAAVLTLLFTVSAQAQAQPETDVVSTKTMNVYAAPLGLLLGTANATAAFKISESLAVGPSFAYSSYSAGSVSATGIGLGAEAILSLGRPTFVDSWFFAPFLGWSRASSEGISVSGLATGANLGYWWHWENGFNLALGGGVQYVTLDFAALGLGSISGMLPSLKFSIGYAF